MIVTPLFKGDDNEDLMKIQFDLYNANLQILVYSAQKIYKNSIEILEINNDLLIQSVIFETFDHRSFQYHHDIIAAYYRFEFSESLQNTLFENEKEFRSRLKIDWISYWENEISELNKNPKWISNVIKTVIMKGNTSIFQNSLISSLKNRYHEFKECPYFNNVI